jgi:hypothetical protein
MVEPTPNWRSNRQTYVHRKEKTIMAELEGKTALITGASLTLPGVFGAEVNSD